MSGLSWFFAKRFLSDITIRERFNPSFEWGTSNLIALIIHLNEEIDALGYRKDSVSFKGNLDGAATVHGGNLANTPFRSFFMPDTFAFS